MTGATIFLLVEDDPHDAYLVEHEFRRNRHLRLIHVGDARAAVRYLTGEGEYGDRKQYPLPQVILLDLKMPGLSGFEFLEWLHSESPGEQRLIPVIVMSSSALQQDIKRAYALGVNSYLSKPIKWDAFNERIKALGVFWAEHAEKPEV
jgi:CheY-like chemotaxis protein